MSKEYLKFQKGDIAALKKIEGIVAHLDSFDADRDLFRGVILLWIVTHNNMDNEKSPCQACSIYFFSVSIFSSHI